MNSACQYILQYLAAKEPLKQLTKTRPAREGLSINTSQPTLFHIRPSSYYIWEVTQLQAYLLHLACVPELDPESSLRDIFWSIA